MKDIFSRLMGVNFRDFMVNPGLNQSLSTSQGTDMYNVYVYLQLASNEDETVKKNNLNMKI